MANEIKPAREAARSNSRPQIRGHLFLPQTRANVPSRKHRHHQQQQGVDDGAYAEHKSMIRDVFSDVRATRLVPAADTLMRVSERLLTKVEDLGKDTEPESAPSDVGKTSAVIDSGVH